MKHITKTPTVGQKLVYVQAGNILPCEVVSVAAAVCQIKLLGGGLNNSLANKVMRVHMAMLRTAK